MVAAAVYSSFAVQPVLAQEGGPQTTILGNLGTTGIGLTMATSLSSKSKWVYRADAGHLSYSTTTREGNVDYDFKLKTTTGMVSADYHLFGGSFKASFGLALLGSDFTLEGRPNSAGVYDVNGRPVPAGQNDFLRAVIDLPTLAPYVGFGWSNLNEPGWGLRYYADLGVMLGNIKTRLEASPNVQRAAGADNLEAERRQIEDAVDYGVIPVARFGVGLRFK